MGAHWGSIRVVLGLYWDNGRYNGNYYLGFMFSEFRVRIVARTGRILSHVSI